MCRLVAYVGDEMLLSDVLIKPDDSIVKQSLLAQESSVPTNGDGFGLGWYVPQISTDPALFLSTFPAWNDENLLHLADKIKSSLFFAHVRAASIGGVNNYNCHPFSYNQWLFMHNGQIDNFCAIKRSLINLLDDDIYQWIKGQTDSEHLFALFLQLAKEKDLTQLTTVADVLQASFDIVHQLLTQAGQVGSCYYNICLTDGQRVVASRYCTDKSVEPESMHYLEGQFFWSEAAYNQSPTSTLKQCVLIASEQLTSFSSQWRIMPADHFLLVDKDYTTWLKPIYKAG